MLASIIAWVRNLWAAYRAPRVVLTGEPHPELTRAQRQRLELTDYAVMCLVTAAWVVATVYLFKHPSETTFATWGTICGIMTAAYQSLLLIDSKHPDANP